MILSLGRLVLMAFAVLCPSRVLGSGYEFEGVGARLELPVRGGWAHRWESRLNF